MACRELDERPELLDKRPGDRQFSLDYNYDIKKDFQFIRKGGEKEPIDGDLRCLKPSDENDYERAMDNPNHVPKQIDFRLREDGCIDHKRSTGLSTFTELKELPGHFRKKPARLWMLSVGSPFPKEITIRPIEAEMFTLEEVERRIDGRASREISTCCRRCYYNERIKMNGDE